MSNSVQKRGREANRFSFGRGILSGRGFIIHPAKTELPVAIRLRNIPVTISPRLSDGNCSHAGVPAQGYRERESPRTLRYHVPTWYILQSDTIRVTGSARLFPLARLLETNALAGHASDGGAGWASTLTDRATWLQSKPLTRADRWRYRPPACRNHARRWCIRRVPDLPIQPAGAGCLTTPFRSPPCIVARTVLGAARSASQQHFRRQGSESGSDSRPFLPLLTATAARIVGSWFTASVDHMAELTDETVQPCLLLAKAGKPRRRGNRPPSGS
jgi:hypothetical protein